MTAYIEWRYSKRLGRDRAILRVGLRGKLLARSTTYPRSQEAQATRDLEAFAAEVLAVCPGTPRRMADAWLASMEGTRAEGTIDGYRSKIDQLLKAMPETWKGWNQKALDAAAEAYRKGRSARSGNYFTQASERFLGYAHLRGLTHLPLRLSRIACKRSERRLPTLHTPEDVGRLVEASRGSGWPVVPLAYYAGLRRSEVRRLVWEDVEPDAIIVRPGKTALERRIPIHPDLRPFLTPRGQGRVVRGSWKSATWYRRLKRLYAKAGVEYPRGRPLHILRHSFCSHLLAKGAPIVPVRDLMGHTDIRTTNRYANGDERLRAQAMELL